MMRKAGHPSIRSDQVEPVKVNTGDREALST